MRHVRSALAVLASLVIPGLGSAAIGRRQDRWPVVGGFVGAVLIGVSWVLTRTDSQLLEVAANPKALAVIAVGAAVVACVHAWSLFDAYASTSSQKPKWATATVIGLSGAVVVPYAWVGSTALDQRSTLMYVFDKAPESTLPVKVSPVTLAPSAAAANPMPEVTASPAVTSSAPESFSTPSAAPGRRTWMLLGGDAGKGRWSRRTDSIIVVSSELETGATAVVSVPRNLLHLPFPEGPLRTQFPDGFPDLANAVYVWGTGHPEFAPGASDPGIEVLRQGVSELLGWPIDNYILVDMAGFAAVVDAIGGIDIVATSNVAPTGPLPGGGRQVGGFEKGERRHMDGEEALAYSRSRTGSSDYARMRRQRCVVEAIADRATSLDLLSRLDEIQNVIRDHVVTDVQLADLPELVGVLGRITSGTATSLLLAPPVIKPSAWELSEVRALVQHTWDQATGVASPVAPATPALPTPSSDAVEDLREACPS